MNHNHHHSNDVEDQSIIIQEHQYQYCCSCGRNSRRQRNHCFPQDPLAVCFSLMFIIIILSFVLLIISLMSPLRFCGRMEQT